MNTRVDTLPDCSEYRSSSFHEHAVAGSAQ
jgi:hypothetical protein